MGYCIIEVKKGLRKGLYTDNVGCMYKFESGNSIKLNSLTGEYVNSLPYTKRVIEVKIKPLKLKYFFNFESGIYTN